MEDLIKAYGAVGAGGLSLLVVIWLLIFMVQKMYPLINSIKEDNSAYREIIKNNTDAVKEVSKSNENVATALKLLDSSVSQLGSLIDKHDTRAEDIQTNLIRMDEKINSLKELK